MSELKAHRIDNIISAYKIGKAFCMKTEEEVYIKSEADKVIAELEKDKLELKQRVNVLEGRLFGLSQSHNIETYTCGCLEREISELKNEKEYTLEHTTEVINAQEKEIRRQKYKRCLAMAKWCDRMFSITFGKERYWQKWNRRWLELADEFKPNKE